MRLTLICHNGVDKPDGGLFVDILVSVDLLLLVSPVRKLLGVCPHGDLGWNMNQAEVAGFALPWVALHGIIEAKLEQSIIVAGQVLLWPCGELLVCGHEGRRNVVGHEVSLSVDMQQLDDILVTDNTATTSLGKSLGGNDLPEVVGIVVPVAGNLLAY